MQYSKRNISLSSSSLSRKIIQNNNRDTLQQIIMQNKAHYLEVKLGSSHKSCRISTESSPPFSF